MKFMVILLLLIITLTNGSVMIEPRNKGAAPGTCISKSFPIGVMKIGKSKNVARYCMLAHCLKDGSISYEGCSAMAVPKGCVRVKPDLTAPFPKCCNYDYIC